MTLVARLKVTLSDVEPQVLRRFDVPLKIKLNRLHDVIQAAMGWTDSHLYEFQAGGASAGVSHILNTITTAHCLPAKPACSMCSKMSAPRPSITSMTLATTGTM